MGKIILEAMKKAGKPVRPGDIAKILGIDSKEVSKAISTLKEKGEVLSPKRCYYSLATDEQ
ncbi:MAG: hypothetical protein QG552_94 [Thermodesulfobacteriota bacterium]|nr:hypothetical protein [Thermodesulfobacteriota bacterium]